jgi:hypothetical protein
MPNSRAQDLPISLGPSPQFSADGLSPVSRLAGAFLYNQLRGIKGYGKDSAT